MTDTTTIKRTRGWTNDEQPAAECPLCGESDTLTRESYWNRDTRCSSCRYHGRVVWNRDGGHSAYVISTLENESDPESARGRYGVANVVSGHRWVVKGWRPEIEDYPPSAPLKTLPGYVLDAVHVEWAKDQLRADLPPGTTVYTILHHVGSSGMSRRIGVRVIVDGEPRYIDGLVAIAIGARVSDREGIIMGGCGMDMGFEVVYQLSCALYPDGFDCIGEKCPSNDHSNGNRDYTPHHHSSGGYALRHRWM